MPKSIDELFFFLNYISCKCKENSISVKCLTGGRTKLSNMWFKRFPAVGHPGLLPTPNITESLQTPPSHPELKCKLGDTALGHSPQLKLKLKRLRFLTFCKNLNKRPVPSVVQAFLSSKLRDVFFQQKEMLADLRTGWERDVCPRDPTWALPRGASLEGHVLVHFEMRKFLLFLCHYEKT